MSSQKYSIYFYPNSIKHPNKKYLFWDSSSSLKKYVLHPDFKIDDRVELKILSASLDLEVSKAGKLEIDLPFSNPFLNLKIDGEPVLKEKVTRFYINRTDSNGDTTTLWCGRLLSKQRNFYNGIKLTCEGMLTYLLDVVQRPYDFETIADWWREHDELAPPMDGVPISEMSLRIYIEFLKNRYNNQAQKDKTIITEIRGDAEDITEESINKKFKMEEYSNTYNELINNVLPIFEGFILTEYSPSSDINYRNKIIFCTNKNGYKKAKQPIKFGKNLLDFTENISSENLYTRVIPLGETYSEIENYRRKTYEEWAKERKKDGHEEPSWEDSGYAMKEDVDQNTKIGLNAYINGKPKINFYWKSAWYDETLPVKIHDVEVPADTLRDKKTEDIYGKNTVAVAFDMGKILKNKKYGGKEIKDTKKDGIIKYHSNAGLKRMPESKESCDNLLEMYVDKLKSKGQKWLDKNNKLNVELTINAIDLAYLYGEEYIDIGTSVECISEPHGLDSRLLCTSASLDLVNVSNSSFTFGGSFDALTDKSVKNKERSGKAYSIASSNY